jgi:hypothetical protein
MRLLRALACVVLSFAVSWQDPVNWSTVQSHALFSEFKPRISRRGTVVTLQVNLGVSDAGANTVPTVTLSNGVKMPVVLLGMGPWCHGKDCYNDTQAEQDVNLAISLGYSGASVLFCDPRRFLISIHRHDRVHISSPMHGYGDAERRQTRGRTAAPGSPWVSF